jgi:ketosteroid isomerase-like protein
MTDAAGALLEAVATRDLDSLAPALADDVRMRVLLPGGPDEWTGPAGVVGAFHGWFDPLVDLALVDSSRDVVGPKQYVRWRLHIREAGADWHFVEQHVYLRTDDAGLIRRIDLLCSGFWPAS